MILMQLLNSLRECALALLQSEFFKCFPPGVSYFKVKTLSVSAGIENVILFKSYLTLY